MRFGDYKTAPEDYSVHKQREAAATMPPDAWDAWRKQRAPDMFETEVTHRG